MRLAKPWYSGSWSEDLNGHVGKQIDSFEGVYGIGKKMLNIELGRVKLNLSLVVVQHHAIILLCAQNLFGNR